jgi:DNA-binding NarL/FixJ family response regulator
VRITIIGSDRNLQFQYKKNITCLISGAFVTTYGCIKEALQYIPDDVPEYIILDIGDSGMKGIDDLGKLKSRRPQVKILLLSTCDTEQILFGALKNGVAGILFKRTDPSEVMVALMEILSGGAAMSSDALKKVIESFFRCPESPLSRKENQILIEILNGKTRPVIARELLITAETVKTHLKNIYAKLGVHSKADAIKYVKENRLL